MLWWYCKNISCSSVNCMISISCFIFQKSILILQYCYKSPKNNCNCSNDLKQIICQVFSTSELLVILVYFLDRIKTIDSLMKNSHDKKRGCHYSVIVILLLLFCSLHLHYKFQYYCLQSSITTFINLIGICKIIHTEYILNSYNLIIIIKSFIWNRLNILDYQILFQKLNTVYSKGVKVTRENIIWIK